MPRPLFVVLSLALASSLAGCGGDDATATPTPPAAPAGDDAGADASLPFCGVAGVSKGPWVVAVDGASAKIRVETCEPQPAGLTARPEGGGAELTATATVSDAVVKHEYKSLLPELPVDVAGTYLAHEVALTGLAPATCYEYSLEAPPAPKGRFCTSRAPGEAFTFAAIGDTNPGLGSTTADLIAQLLPRKPDFTIHGGDIQYYASVLETYASWFPIMAPLLRSGAFLPAMGNHEHEKPDELETYVQRFWGGAGFDGAGGYYTFASGGVHFFALDTEVDIYLASPQGAWLADALEKAHASPGFRFSVLYLHRPLVTCGDKSQSTSTRKEFEPLFSKFGVKLVFGAHMHGYERFEIGDVTYITTGGGGGALGKVDENLDREECASRVASGAFFHAMVIEVNASGLHGEAVGPDGAVVDSFDRAAP